MCLPESSGLRWELHRPRRVWLVAPHRAEMPCEALNYRVSGSKQVEFTDSDLTGGVDPSSAVSLQNVSVFKQLFASNIDVQQQPRILVMPENNGLLFLSSGAVVERPF